MAQWSWMSLSPLSMAAVAAVAAFAAAFVACIVVGCWLPAVGVGGR